jgi:hypothetical protein
MNLLDLPPKRIRTLDHPLGFFMNRADEPR